MVTILAFAVLSIVVGFIWICARDVKATNAAVARIEKEGELNVDATFRLAPTGALLIDYSGRKIGLANASFPTHFNQAPLSMGLSISIEFNKILKTSISQLPGSTMVRVHFSLAEPNFVNGDTYITVSVDARNKDDVTTLESALLHAGLIEAPR